MSASLHVVKGQAAEPRRYKLRVVLVDDDRDTANTLAVLLRDDGDEVHAVFKGDEALDACRLIRPDVVIADLNMPGISGYAIARDLRERHGQFAPLLIALTGQWTKTSDRLVGQAVGFDHYLLKPCDPRELSAILQPLREGKAAAVGS